MEWEQYSKNYIKKACQMELDKKSIDANLAYAKKLYDKKVPIIYDQYHLSLLVGYEYEYLLGASNKTERFYRKFTISKKSGGTRSIHEPLPSLKEIQHWILNEILNKLEVSIYAKAYVKNRSIKDNAKFHKNQKKVLNMDIKDFFGTITFVQVLKIFVDIGYRKSVSVMLANLCYLKKELPQGAPTSPQLSNLIMKGIDEKFSRYAKKNEIRYTRYADDLTFSGDFRNTIIVRDITIMLRDKGFNVNTKKTRIQYAHQRQQVTGIITNNIMQAPQEDRKKLRQEMYYIKTYGLNSHLEYHKIIKPNYLYHLLGIANYIYFINPKDKEVKEYIDILKLMMENRS